MTLTSGDIVLVDLGVRQGREAGFPRPAVVITAQRVLDQEPTVIHVVPVTSTIRGFESEVPIDPDEHNGLDVPSAVQCQHVRSVSTTRARLRVGNIGPTRMRQVRESVALLLDL